MSRSQDVYLPHVNNYLPEHTSFPLVPLPKLTKPLRGEDPKPDFIPHCETMCHDLGKHYESCEKARTDPKATNKPTTCLHVYREWMECVEGCVQPKVINNLYGANMRYHFWF